MRARRARRLRLPRAPEFVKGALEGRVARRRGREQVGPLGEESEHARVDHVGQGAAGALCAHDGAQQGEQLCPRISCHVVLEHESRVHEIEDGALLGIGGARLHRGQRVPVG